MSAATALYTREVLALATSLARWPYDDALPLQGSARAPTCGSTVDLNIAIDEAGRITQLGLRARACAIGQAATAIFAENAPGMDAAQLEAAYTEIAQWLAEGNLPGWPGFAAIARAREYPARHGAILLPWRAALVAMDQPR
ncbi:MAG: iron-sulfur cluster assembly scaffold protein [Novosphingobium sp.]|uniref:iron-sulfur cluster assembly scaffold protein n=1 Tax=Novosphingobium sp. TaxID=1874826 RepID=UPI0032BBA9E9